MPWHLLTKGKRLRPPAVGALAAQEPSSFRDPPSAANGRVPGSQGPHSQGLCCSLLLRPSTAPGGSFGTPGVALSHNKVSSWPHLRSAAFSAHRPSMLTSHVILGLFHLPKTSEGRATHSDSMAKPEVSLGVKEPFGTGTPRGSMGTSQGSPCS